MQNEDRSEELVEQQEPIEIETRYMWEAVYEHGAATLPEWERIDGEVVQHGFGEIDVERATGFILHDLASGGSPCVVQLDHAAGQRLIFFRRHGLELDMATGEQIKQPPIHVVGWQKTIGGQNASIYLFLFPDGSLLLSDTHEIERGIS